jgi:predicted metal-dependent phosphoesterase TrpH
MEIDLHIHSRYSPDSFSKPEDIARRAKHLGLGAIAVTDHDSWGGSRAVAEAAGSSLIVVPGAELKTDKGDLLALFVDGVKAREWALAVDEIRAKGGVSIVPHPAESKRLTADDLRMADALEIYNAKCGRFSNERAALMADELEKPGFGSSDAHMVMSIGNGRTTARDCGSLEDLRQHVLREPKVTTRIPTNPLLTFGYAATCFGLKGVWQKKRSV